MSSAGPLARTVESQGLKAMVIELRKTDIESAPEPSSSRVVVDPYPPTSTKPELVTVLVWPRLLIMVCHRILDAIDIHKL